MRFIGIQETWVIRERQRRPPKQQSPDPPASMVVIAFFVAVAGAAVAGGWGAFVGFIGTACVWGLIDEMKGA